MSTKTSQEEIVQQFSKMRLDQQQNAQKLAELEQDLQEHKVVTEVLEGVDKSRKCFRMVGEVLVERTVADILPALKDNMKQLSVKVEQDKKQLMDRSQAVLAYQQKHGIRVQFRGARNSAPATIEEQPEPTAAIAQT